MNKKYRGFLLVLLGVVMVAAGMGLHIIHERQDELAGQNAGILLNELSNERKFNEILISDTPQPEQTQPVTGTSQQSEAPAPESGEPEEMPTRTLSGYDLIGILRAPTVGVELPVLSSWSYPLLNVAPCRYSGSLDAGNLIILGHNYKSHLQPLERVSVGDRVEFTDVSGVVHSFCVAAVERIHEGDPEKLASEHPLIVFTCTRDGNYRIVIRCDKIEG